MGSVGCETAPVPVFRVVTDIAAPPATCFDLARSIDLHLESMITSGERAVAGVTTGLIAAGEEVSWEARHFGILWRMTSRIVEFDPPHRFVDQMVRGPFAAFRHEHHFDAAGAGTRMTDVISFRMSLGPVVDLPVGLYLKRLMRIRNAAIRQAAERS
jgi:ligand-binding SRPBCC domain-containing protein